AFSSLACTKATARNFLIRRSSADACPVAKLLHGNCAAHRRRENLAHCFLLANCEEAVIAARWRVIWRERGALGYSAADFSSNDAAMLCAIRSAAFLTGSRDT